MSGVVRRARELGGVTIPTNLRLFRRLEVMRRMTLRTSNAFGVSIVVGVRNFRVAGRAGNCLLLDVFSMRLMTANAVNSCAVRNLNTGVTRHTRRRCLHRRVRRVTIRACLMGLNCRCHERWLRGVTANTNIGVRAEIVRLMTI